MADELSRYCVAPEEDYDDVIKWKRFLCYWPSQRVSNAGFDVSFDVSLNKRIDKQSSHWWFETSGCTLWRHCKVVWGDKGYVYLWLLYSGQYMDNTHRTLYKAEIKCLTMYLWNVNTNSMAEWSASAKVNIASRLAWLAWRNERGYFCHDCWHQYYMGTCRNKAWGVWNRTT